eukprot:s487_g17.t1
MAGNERDSSAAVKRFDGEGEDPGKQLKKWRTWALAKMMTLKDLNKQQRAPWLLTLLDGKAWDACEHLTLEQLSEEEAGEALLWKTLQERFPEKEQHDMMGEILGEVFALAALDQESMKQWTARVKETFEKCQRRAQVNFPEQARGWIALNCAGLSEEQKAIVKAKTQGSLDFDAVSAALRSCFPQYRASGRKKATGVLQVEQQDDDDKREHQFDDIEAFLTEHNMAFQDDSREGEDQFSETEAAEALAISWKERRREIAEFQQARQFGAAGKSKRSFRIEVEELKKRTRCRKCNKLGHWARECRASGTQSSADGGTSTTTGTSFNYVAVEAGAGGTSTTTGTSVNYVTVEAGAEDLAESPVADEEVPAFVGNIKEYAVENLFRFGNGAVERSEVAVRIPVGVAGQLGMIDAAVISGNAPLLIGRPTLEKMRARIDFSDGTLHFLNTKAKMTTNAAGQVLIDVLDFPNKIARSKTQVQDSHAGSETGAKEYDGLKTCPGCKCHRPIEGKLSNGQNVSTFCAEYTNKFVSSMMGMCQPFVKAVTERQSGILLSEMHEECLAGQIASNQEAAVPPSPEGSNPADASKSKNIESAIKKLHNNLGHPSTKDLVRILRHSNASAAAVKAAQEFSCDVCKNHSHPASALPAKTSRTMEFNEKIADAHWQLGKVERHGQWFAQIFERVIDECRPQSAEEFVDCVMQTLCAKNALISESGVSPYQLVFGRNPRIPQDLLQDDIHVPASDAVLAESGYQRSQAIRQAARLSVLQCQDNRALRLALRARPRPRREFVSGDWVYYWRSQKWQNGVLLRGGRWHGAGLIIGRIGVNWIVAHKRHLFRCSPEHLRLATADEKTVAQFDSNELLGIKTLLEKGQIPKGQFVDLISQDPPHDPESVEQNVRQSAFAKTAAELGEKPSEEKPIVPSAPEVMPGSVGNEEVLSAEVSQSDVRSHIEVLMAAFLQKRAQKELKPSGHSYEVQSKIDESKKTEWETLLGKNAIKIHTGEAARQIKKKQSHRFIGSRFVVVHKSDEDGDRIKSRWCLQGHLDPDFKEKPSSGLCHSPTLHPLSRALILQLLVSNRWLLQLGDIKGAFLEAGALNPKFSPLYAHQPQGGIPGIDSEAVIEVVGNVYGSNDAPFNWWHTFDAEVVSGQWKRSQFDNCLYYLYEPSTDGSKPKLCGILGAHVDDTITGGSGPFYEAAIAKLKQRFPYRKWRQGNGEFCGVTYCQDPQTMEMSYQQRDYAQHMRPISLSKERQRNKEIEASDKEIAALRAINGAANWLSSQSRPDLSVQTSFSQQCFPKPKVKDLLYANQVVHRAKQYSHVEITVKYIPISELCVCFHSDAGFGNAKANSTQAGYLAAFSNIKLADNESSVWSPFAWKSYKLARKAASTLAGEAQAYATAAAVSEWMALMLAEAVGGQFDLRSSSHWQDSTAPTVVISGMKLRDQIEKIPIIGRTDCKSLYANLTSMSSVSTTDDKRVAIDIAIVRQSMSRCGLITRWCPTELMLADGLTKDQVDPADLLRSALHLGEYQLHSEATILEQKKKMRDERDRRKIKQMQLEEEQREAKHQKQPQN